MPTPRIFVDTNVLKFAATELRRLRPRTQRIHWGGKEFDAVVHDIVKVNPNEFIRNADLKAEADLLPGLAELGVEGTVHFLTQLEAELESWGLPKMNSERGHFYGTPIELVEAPFKYSRIIVSAEVRSRLSQFEFLKSVSSPRFDELQRISGAYQGKNEPNGNQLLDAFHLWCAEHARADFFLTLDFKLIKAVRRVSTKYFVPVVRPSELLAALSLALDR